jgi:hypothetical protein
LSRKINNLVTGHGVTTEGKPLIDRKVFEVIQGRLPETDKR